MKKVMLLCGNPRIRGNTAQVVEECTKVIRESGLETDNAPLAGMKIESCTACYRGRGMNTNRLFAGIVTRLVNKLE